MVFKTTLHLSAELKTFFVKLISNAMGCKKQIYWAVKCLKSKVQLK